MSALQEKTRRLQEEIKNASPLIVAYSGGVDSAYLAYAAHRALGGRMLAVTALSASFSSRDRAMAEATAQQFSFPHEFIETEELSNPEYRANNPNRCFFCKDELFTKLDELAARQGFNAVAYGVNTDDRGDWRPGERAARKHRVLTPLVDCGLGKADIRTLAREAGLPVWDRPASACLASRIAYGLEVTPERLSVIEKAEESVRSLGFRQFRVRHHGNLARLEVAPEEMARALDVEMARRFAEIFRSLGFAYATIDLDGYRRGSLNTGIRGRN
ncbi:MAG: ATP-dependent sacrificial sulfur transferase LarE [Terriglobia bacterium]